MAREKTEASMRVGAQVSSLPREEAVSEAAGVPTAHKAVPSVGNEVAREPPAGRRAAASISRTAATSRCSATEEANDRAT